MNIKIIKEAMENSLLHDTVDYHIMHSLVYDSLFYLDNVKCVYLLHNKSKLYYIGQTKNLKNRWNSHIINTELLRCPWKAKINYIEFIKIDDDNDRFLLEKYLIQTLKPKHNALKYDKPVDFKQIDHIDIEDNKYRINFTSLRHMYRLDSNKDMFSCMHNSLRDLEMYITELNRILLEGTYDLIDITYYFDILKKDSRVLAYLIKNLNDELLLKGALSGYLLIWTKKEQFFMKMDKFLHLNTNDRMLVEKDPSEYYIDRYYTLAFISNNFNAIRFGNEKQERRNLNYENILL